MEDTLREMVKAESNENVVVLILVLMEDTLRVSPILNRIVLTTCLNPCFNGRYSQRRPIIWIVTSLIDGLNPCFNGRYSQRQ